MTRPLSAIFFISGATALMFETLWFRQAGLAFGNSVWASSLVLSGFMAGLALGNALAAREGGRFKDPVRLYAFVELAVGVTGVLLVIFLPQLGRLLSPLFLPILDRPWLINPLRLLFAFLLLLVPSTAMGTTLPLLTKALATSDPLFGRILGRLYGWNTMGAVMGVLLTEFILIGAVGIKTTAWLAGFLNLVIALIALQLSKQHRQREQLEKTEPIQKTPSSSGNRLSTIRFYLVAAFISGFCLLALEIVWFRFLMLFVLGHSESFALMLAIVLAGIAIGGFTTSLGLRFWPAISQEAGAIIFFTGMVSVLSYAAFPVFIDAYADAVITQPSEILRVGIPLMLPVSFLSGTFFTLIGSALRGHFDTETATTGSLTFANTMGAALGAFCAGFALLPVLGMERSFFLIASLYGLTGLLLLRSAPSISRLAYVAAGLFGLSILLFPNGVMARRHLVVPSQRLLSPGVEGKVLAVREGRIETISYMEQQWEGKPLSYRLVTNAYSMSSSDVRARRYMKLFVYWPIALHPNPKHALLISYGIGSTAKALTDTKALERIDVVDISKAILEMNDIVYSDPKTHPLRDPRVQVHIEDARYYLQTTNQRFDLITGEPPPPEIAGVVNLYTREYFRLLYDRLNEGGIVSYWLPLHSINAKSAKAILRAFCEVFEDCSLWHGQWLDFMMVGTRQAKGPVSETQFKRQWEDTVVSRELADIGLERPEQLGALFIGDASTLVEITRGTWPLVDDFPKRVKVSYGPRMELVKLIDGWLNTSETQSRFLRSDLIRQLWPKRLQSEAIPYFRFQDMMNRLWFGMRNPSEPLIADLHKVLTDSPLETLPLWLLGSNADFVKIVSESSKEALESPSMQAHLAMQQMANRQYGAAADAFARAQADPKLEGDAFNYRIYALSMAGRTEEAKALVAAKMSLFLEKQKQEGLAGPPPLSPFWSWMEKNREIDPFAITQIE